MTNSGGNGQRIEFEFDNDTISTGGFTDSESTTSTRAATVAIAIIALLGLGGLWLLASGGSSEPELADENAPAEPEKIGTGPADTDEIDVGTDIEIQNGYFVHASDAFASRWDGGARFAIEGAVKTDDGWLSAANGTVVKSTDGARWTAINPDQTKHVEGLLEQDENVIAIVRNGNLLEGYTVTNDGLVLATDFGPVKGFSSTDEIRIDGNVIRSVVTAPATQTHPAITEYISQFVEPELAANVCQLQRITLDGTFQFRLKACDGTEIGAITPEDQTISDDLSLLEDLTRGQVSMKFSADGQPAETFLMPVGFELIGDFGSDNSVLAGGFDATAYLGDSTGFFGFFGDMELHLWTPETGINPVDGPSEEGKPWIQVNIASLSDGRFVHATTTEVSVLDVATTTWESIPSPASGGFDSGATFGTIDGEHLVMPVVGGTIQVSADGLSWTEEFVGRTDDIPMLVGVDGVVLARTNPAGFFSTRFLDAENEESRPTINTAGLPGLFPRTMADGEWETPIFTGTSSNDQFVGLMKQDGAVSFVTSIDGVNIDRQTPSDFPFGYAVDKIETHADGYFAIGKLGVLDQSVFTSTDGISWQQEEFTHPDGATAIEIRDFAISYGRRVMWGAVGWVDDLSRTENVLLHWAEGEGNTPTVVPNRPCTSEPNCVIQNVTAIPDVDGEGSSGIVAGHTRGESLSISIYVPNLWIPIEDFSGDTTIATMTDDDLVLIADREVRVVSAEEITLAPAETGAFIATKPDGSQSIYLDGDEIYIGNDELWLVYTMPPDASVDSVRVTNSKYAILSGTSTDGPITIQVEFPAA